MVVVDPPVAPTHLVAASAKTLPAFEVGSAGLAALISFSVRSAFFNMGAKQSAWAFVRPASCNSDEIFSTL